MRNPTGYARITSPDGTSECDTFTCHHCNTIVHAKGDDIGGFCRNCMQLICPKCVGQDCTPFLKRIEHWEKFYRKTYL